MDKPASPRPTGLTGIVLAGGKSMRLGQPKPLVFIGGSLGGRLVLDRMHNALNRVCDEQILVVRPDQDDDVPDTAIALGMHVVADSFEGMGPLGGVEAGLAAAQTELTFVPAGDHPFLSSKVVAAMAELAEGYDTVVPRLDNLLRPLHAVYRRSTWLPVMRVALSGQRVSPSALLDDATVTGSPKVLILDETDLTKWDPNLSSFHDAHWGLQQDRRRIRGRGG